MHVSKTLMQSTSFLTVDHQWPCIGKMYNIIQGWIAECMGMELLRFLCLKAKSIDTTTGDYNNGIRPWFSRGGSRPQS